MICATDSAKAGSVSLSLMPILPTLIGRKVRGDTRKYDEIGDF
jgi:hypothetical protein